MTTRSLSAGPARIAIGRSACPSVAVMAVAELARELFGNRLPSRAMSEACANGFYHFTGQTVGELCSNCGHINIVHGREGCVLCRLPEMAREMLLQEKIKEAAENS